MITGLPVLSQPSALLLAPLAWLLLWLLYRLRQHGSYWHRVLPASFHAKLIRQPSRPERLPWLLLVLAATLASLALSSPRFPGSGHTGSRVPEPLVIVIELTPDMLAGDLPPSRLHQLRHKALHMLQAQQPGQTGMVLYAGSAHALLPLSSDPVMADNLLQALHPSLMPLPGRNAASGVAKAMELLQQGANGQGRIALLTRGLDSAEQEGIARLLKQHRGQLGILGIGTPQGAPVPDPHHGRFDADAPLSRLQEQQLQRFARQNGAGYARLQHDNSDLIQSGLFTIREGRLQGTDSGPAPDQGYWLLLLILLLLAPLARKGWLTMLWLCLPAWLLQPGQVLASTPLQHIQQDPVAAIPLLQDPLWQGIAAYHAGDYALASDYFAAASGAIAHYNRGNSLMQLGQYLAAATAYQQALELQPGLTQASDNLALARTLQQSGTAGQAAVTLQHGPQGPPGDGSPTTKQTEKTATLRPSDQDFQQGSLDSWLQQIPDNPAALLKRKFQYELQHSAP